MAKAPGRFDGRGGGHWFRLYDLGPRGSVDPPYLAEAQQYSLRRGHISTRILRGESPTVIARQCATSTAMIDRHYYREIDEAQAGGPTIGQQFAAQIAAPSD